MLIDLLSLLSIVISKHKIAINKSNTGKNFVPQSSSLLHSYNELSKSFLEVKRAWREMMYGPSEKDWGHGFLAGTTSAGWISWLDHVRIIFSPHLLCF
jgi:hypothetical protein